MVETLDRDSLKALSTDTRQDIIKLLSERPHTSSELSKKLSKHVTTISEHLGILESAKLIKRKDTGNKWVYYTLTDKGEKIFKPAYYTWVITLSLILVIVAFASLFGLYQLNNNNQLNIAASEKSDALTMPLTSPPQQAVVGDYFADFEKTIETGTSSIVPLTLTAVNQPQETMEIEISNQETEEPIKITSKSGNTRIVKITDLGEHQTIKTQAIKEDNQSVTQKGTSKKFIIKILNPTTRHEKIIPIEISELEENEHEGDEYNQTSGNLGENEIKTINVSIVDPSGNTKEITVPIR